MAIWIARPNASARFIRWTMSAGIVSPAWFFANDASTAGFQHHSSSTLEFKSAGLGLGIPIARGIAEAHGGRLLIESRIGAGTTVTLWIPAEPDAQLEEAA